MTTQLPVRKQQFGAASDSLVIPSGWWCSASLTKWWEMFLPFEGKRWLGEKGRDLSGIELSDRVDLLSGKHCGFDLLECFDVYSIF